MNSENLLVATCGRCDYQLAAIDGAEIMIRIRDQYLYFRGGALRIICRGCGSSNVLMDKNFEIERSEEAKTIFETPGTVRVKTRLWQNRPWHERQKPKKESTNVV